MMFCVLGNITFQALTSPQKIESARGWHFAEHKTVESTPKLQWIGDELEDMTLDILLHVSFSRPATDRAALLAAAEAHKAMPLVFGSGEHRGWFVIVKISETAVKLADDGSPISITLKLALKEWARSIELDPAAPPKPPSVPAGMIVGALQPGQSVAGVVAADGTVSFPASQAGTSALLYTPATAPSILDPSLVSPQTITRMDTALG